MNNVIVLQENKRSRQLVFFYIGQKKHKKCEKEINKKDIKNVPIKKDVLKGAKTKKVKKKTYDG